ncbi:MAG: type IV toxin-antitoxin system AbiEi family antitoxin domain-containing protein [bacterium]
MRTTTEEYRKGLGKKESYLISSLARENKKIFTAEDVKTLIGDGAKNVIYNLIRKKWILKLKRGLYAIVPLDIGVKGAESFAVHSFVIGSKLADPYYIGYWSALNHYGFSDQIPATTFIATTKPKKGIGIMHDSYLFVQLSEKKFFGTTETEIEGEKVRISDENKTIADCLDHPEYCGGIDEIARSIFFSRDEIDFARVKAYALKMGNMAILKRLGCILDSAGLLEEYKDVFEGVRLSKGYALLDPISQKQGSYNDKWGLLVNYELKPDGWLY